MQEMLVGQAAGQDDLRLSRLTIVKHWVTIS